MAEAAGSHSLQFLDAPVSGGQAGAENGALTVMVGGDPTAFAKAQPVIDSYARAVTWYEAAAQQGFAPAQISLALLYDQGLGVEPDSAVARRWYRSAAEQGNVDAQFELAVIYDQGLGVAVDPDQAAFWYRRAAERDDVDAQVRLAELLADPGLDIHDPESAADWFERAAAAGDPRAKLQFAIIIDAGQVRAAAAHDLWLVQNPRSNRGNRVGYPGHLKESRRVALGTDGYPARMADEARALFEEATAHGDDRTAADLVKYLG